MAQVLLQFSATVGWVSRLIRWTTWGTFSHVDFIWPDGRLFGSLPQFGGVCFHPPEQYIRYAVFAANVTSEQANKIYQYALSQEGKPYAWDAIFGFALRMNRWHDNKSFFCSELVAAAFAYAGYPLADAESWRLSPEDLVRSERLNFVRAFRWPAKDTR